MWTIHELFCGSNVADKLISKLDHISAKVISKLNQSMKMESRFCVSIIGIAEDWHAALNDIQAKHTGDHWMDAMVWEGTFFGSCFSRRRIHGVLADVKGFGKDINGHRIFATHGDKDDDKEYGTESGADIDHYSNRFRNHKSYRKKKVKHWLWFWNAHEAAQKRPQMRTQCSLNGDT